MDRPILLERTELAGIPILHVRARELRGPAPTVLFYHGWGSHKENQIVIAEAIACEGLCVILPDAVRHGERNPLVDYDAFEAKVQFWMVVEQSIKEADSLLAAAAAADLSIPARLGVGGSSMGGMIAAGIFARNEQMKAAVICNGCPSLEWLADLHRTERGFPPMTDQERLPFREFDPEALRSGVAPRPLLMLHGDADTSVPIAGVRRFMQEVGPLYGEFMDRLVLSETPRLDHHVTQDMIIQSRAWFSQYV